MHSNSDISNKPSSWVVTVYFSSAHPPKSVSLQRCEQKGRNVFSGFHITDVPHVGHLTDRDVCSGSAMVFFLYLLHGEDA